MKNFLKQTVLLAACLVLLCPSAVFAESDDQAAAIFSPISSASDLSEAIPQSVVSISKLTAPNNVIFNYEGLTITLTGYYLGNDSLYMNLAVNNNTGTRYYIDTVNASLNGLSCNSLASVSAPPNQLYYDYVQLYTSSDIDRYLSMDEISDIEFRLQIIDEDAYRAFYETAGYDTDFSTFTGYNTTGPIHFKDDSVAAKAPDSGTVLYQENGIRIVKKDLFIRNYGPADLHLVLYLENTNSETVYINNDTSLLNNYSVESSFAGPLEAGESCIAHMVIAADELKGLNIQKLSDIKKFEGMFSFYKGMDDYGYYSYYDYSYENGERIKTTAINFLK